MQFHGNLQNRWKLSYRAWYIKQNFLNSVKWYNLWVHCAIAIDKIPKYHFESANLDVVKKKFNSLELFNLISHLQKCTSRPKSTVEKSFLETGRSIWVVSSKMKIKSQPFELDENLQRPLNWQCRCSSFASALRKIITIVCIRMNKFLDV